MRYFIEPYRQFQCIIQQIIKINAILFATLCKFLRKHSAPTLGIRLFNYFKKAQTEEIKAC
jgi:hypothetical protein